MSEIERADGCTCKYERSSSAYAMNAKGYIVDSTGCLIHNPPDSEEAAHGDKFEVYCKEHVGTISRVINDDGTPAGWVCDDCDHVMLVREAPRVGESDDSEEVQREPFIFAEFRKARAASKMNERLTFTFYTEDVGQALYEYDLQREEAQRVAGLLTEAEENRSDMRLLQASFIEADDDRLALRQRVDAMEKDKARLDWLTKQDRGTLKIAIYQNGHAEINPTGEIANWHVGNTLREAIDAALEATPDPAKDIWLGEVG